MAVQFQQKTAVKKNSQGLGDSGEEWKITHHGLEENIHMKMNNGQAH